MSNNYLERLFSMPDKERNELFQLIEESLPDDIIEEISQRFADDEDDTSSKWVQIGHYHFLKRGNSFYAIETMMFGDNFIGIVYDFNISVTDDMVDYFRLANESRLKFLNDSYKLAYGVARTIQLEEAIAIKLSTNLNDLYLWSRQWMLLEKDK